MNSKYCRDCNIEIRLEIELIRNREVDELQYSADLLGVSGKIRCQDIQLINERGSEGNAR